MPSFPEMVAYVQEKVRFSSYWRQNSLFKRQIKITRWQFFAKVNLVLHFLNLVIIRQPRGSRLQLSTLLGPPLLLSTHLHLGR